MSNRHLLGRIVQGTGRIVRPFSRATIPRAELHRRVYKEANGEEAERKTVQPSPYIAHGKEWRLRTPGINAYLAQLPTSIACWTCVVVLESGLVLIADAMQGYILPLSHYLTWAAFNWYAWAFLTPAILAWRAIIPSPGRTGRNAFSFPTHSHALPACWFKLCFVA